MKLILKSITRTIFALCVVLACSNVAMADIICPISDGDVVYIPNPDDASSYYECDNGKPVSMCCPRDTYFCSEKSSCTWLWDSECAFTDTKMPADEGHCWYYTNPPLPSCPCYTGTATTESINIYGGVKKTITTPKGCSTGYCECRGCPGTTVVYSCECNSGYTASNQGTNSCNCIQCDAGSYVGGTLASPTCIPCPKNDDVAQTIGQSKSKNTSTSPTSCYLPASTTYTDTTGDYSFSSQCDYSL